MRRKIIGASIAAAMLAGSTGGAFAVVPGFEAQYEAARVACTGPAVAADCQALLRAYLAAIGLTGPALQTELAALRADFGTSPATVAAINSVVGGTGAGGATTTTTVATSPASGTSGGPVPGSGS